MTKMLLVGGLMLGMALSAFVARAQDDLGSVDPTSMVAPAPTIAPADVLKIMQNKDPHFALVDTQPAEGFAEGHIPGALNYPWVMRVKVFPIDLPRNKTLIFYGSCPNDTSDTIKQLAEFGYHDVRVMDGGWYKWLELKYPSAGTGENAAPQPNVSQQRAMPEHRENVITAQK